ncbi:Glycerophosphodiesterase [Phytophthora palmivora]|uniref:Glycerophosphodiesterase n=1 Tax=Phytophthora palmivora TaxID=4796 RepID=A0A2P4X680_9STRA|nr:Glycerophosphodiesterase [Phytophthora palmivora]
MDAMTKQRSEAQVEFAVRLLGDASERVVCLLGSATELGAWDVEKAVAMELVERREDESKWRATVAFVAATNTLEYKYVVKHAETRELLSWEGLPGNRTLTIAPGSNVALRALATQSSTYATTRAPMPGTREAKLGNNGHTNGFQEWRCCRTNKEMNPWWEVDLGKDYAISSIHVWNAMTYHEQARHPDGRPPVTSKASTSSPAPPLWLFISNEPLSRGEDSYQQAQAKAAVSASSVRAIEVQNSFGSRARSMNFAIGESLHGDDSHDSALEFPAVQGRYVRLQYAGASCSLQFAELEVFTLDNVVAVDGKEALNRNILSLQHDDGFYGVPSALDADVLEYVESGWLNPATHTAELQLWIGSFNTAKPAIQWLNCEPEHDRVTIEMRHERQTKKTGISPVKWESLPVESKSAALLDKESTELRQLLKTHQQQDRVDISGYLNNDPNGPTLPSTLKSSWLSRLAFVQSFEAIDVDYLASKVVSKKA